MLFVGNDWAEAHHDIEIQDGEGRRLARRRLPEGVTGIAVLHALIADHLDLSADPDQVLIGIETDRGPWVQALIAAGYTVYPINPLQVARYRERHGTAGGKSDPGDAHVLAEIVRLDRAHHRPAVGDSVVADQLQLATRAHQNMIWMRQRAGNQLRSQLREFYPAALTAFDDLTGRDALAVLALAPTPSQARRLTTTRVGAALGKAGRQRNLDRTAAAILEALKTEQLPARAGLETVYGATVSALVKVITEMVTQTAVLEAQVKQGFGQHPDVEIYRSQPGLGDVLGARVLAEMGDDPNRFTDARARKNYAGMAPITKTSGKKRVVLARRARNRRLGDALYQQAFCALNTSPGARAYYDRHRAGGATHHQALRTLGNRLVGILHGCLTHHVEYDEHLAWHHQPGTQTAAAA